MGRFHRFPIQAEWQLGQRFSWVADGDSRPSWRLSSSSGARKRNAAAPTHVARRAKRGLALQASLQRAWGRRGT